MNIVLPTLLIRWIRLVVQLIVTRENLFSESERDELISLTYEVEKELNNIW